MHALLTDTAGGSDALIQVVCISTPGNITCTVRYMIHDPYHC